MFKILFRDLETGKWKEEYKYDSYSSACSMLNRKSQGRAGCIKDTSTGGIRDTVEGDSGAYDKFDKK